MRGESLGTAVGYPYFRAVNGGPAPPSSLERGRKSSTNEG